MLRPVSRRDSHVSGRLRRRGIRWQLSLVAKLLRLMLNRLFDRLFTGWPQKPRSQSPP